MTLEGVIDLESQFFPYSCRLLALTVKKLDFAGSARDRDEFWLFNTCIVWILSSLFDASVAACWCISVRSLLAQGLLSTADPEPLFLDRLGLHGPQNGRSSVALHHLELLFIQMSTALA